MKARIAAMLIVALAFCPSLAPAQENNPPTVDAGPDQTVRYGLSLSLAPSTFTDPDPLDVHTAVIDWDDGIVEPGVVDQVNDTVSGSHVFLDPSIFQVRVSVSDDKGGVGFDTFLVTVETSPCTVSLDCDDGNPCIDDICLDHSHCFYYQLPNGTQCDDGDACTLEDVCFDRVCSGYLWDDDIDGYLSDACGGEDCDDDNAAVNPGVPERCSDFLGVDEDCDGLANSADPDCAYPAPANARASTLGSGSLVGSGLFNELALLLIPVGAAIAWRIMRKKN